MSLLNTKSGLNRLFPFAKKKPNIPGKSSDKVDTKVNIHKLVEDKPSDSIRCDILTENNEKVKPVPEKTCSNYISKKVSLETYKTSPSQTDESEIKSKKKKSIARKSSTASNVSIEEIKKPKDNYKRWNIPFSSKFKGKTFDKTLLTMQDLIYYNPVTNPIIKKPKVELKQEDDPDGDLLPIESDQKPSIANNCITPCIKVGADGKIIIDQETLTLNETGFEEKREELAKAKVIEESALHSRSYSYKRKNESSKQWTKNETLRFYKCLMNLGTDFSMVQQYFPGRTRAQIKRKYKNEEKKNPELINGALTNTKQYDSVLIDNMFQEDEPKAIEKGIVNDETEVLVTSELSTPKIIHKGCRTKTIGPRCSKLSAYIIDEEVVLQTKKKHSVHLSTASNIKEQVLSLQCIRAKRKSRSKSSSQLDTTKDIDLSKIDAEKEPKVRRLQDFHEEYEDNITKFEENSNSE